MNSLAVLGALVAVVAVVSLPGQSLQYFCPRVAPDKERQS